MNLKEIKELLDLVVQKGFSEFELEQGGVRVRLKRETTPAAAPMVSAPPLILAPVPAVALPAAPPASAAPPAAQPAAVPSAEAGLHTVKSPIVGTFYEASAPGAAPLAPVGKQVESGTVLCIVEAMKLMNEIESDVAGEVVERLVANGQPVEYGQALFTIRPRK